MSLSAAELATARHDLETMLPDTCGVVTAGTRTPNDSGGWTDAAGTTTTIACRIGPVSSREVLTHGQVATEADAVITLPSDTTVADGGTITHGGITYHVTGVPIERSADWTLRVFVRRA